MNNKRFKFPRKGGYARWLLTKVLNELTGNYFGNTAIENHSKPPKSGGVRVSDENASCADGCDKADTALRKP
jgi:hypothetical protein